MTELDAFLTALYDSFAEAEIQALAHGRARLEEVLEDDRYPRDVSVPVYHASDAQVTLDVGLVAEETESGTEVFVTDAEAADASQLAFTVDLFELLDREDVRRDDRDRTAKPRHREDPPIEVIEDVEPRHREALRSAGIERLSDLVERSPEEIADAVADEDGSVTPEDAAVWLEAARGLAAILSEREAALPVELVDGIGPTYGRRLREHGIEDLAALVERSPGEIADLVSTEESTVSRERAARWLDRAGETLTAMEREGEDATEEENATERASHADRFDANETDTNEDRR